MDGIVLHCIHCALYLSFIGVTIFYSIYSRSTSDTSQEYSGIEAVLVYVFYASQCLCILGFPQCIFNFLGTIYYNTFKNVDNIDRKNYPSLQSRICFRTVTRGNYPELIRQGLRKNNLICVEAGLTNYSIEIVTDNEIDLFGDPDQRLPTNSKHVIEYKSPHIRQVVVPSDYKTSTGALFKARALQFAIEPDINNLKPEDYIVHLDEETILTPSAVKGIQNFVNEGQHHFGQGVITYTNLGIVNPLTTIADCIRVFEDYGKLRFQYKMFHRSIFTWKGSYCVNKAYAEFDVSWDHGIDGSIAEDAYFALIAVKKGYTFDFIEGEMWEKSTYTVSDFIRQRKRWLQGLLLVVHSSEIPFRCKYITICSVYVWAVLPIATLSGFCAQYLTLKPLPVIDTISVFSGATVTYGYLFGIFKSLHNKNHSASKLILYCLIALPCTFIATILENFSVVWAHLSPKHRFYVVDKTVKKSLDEDIA